MPVGDAQDLAWDVGELIWVFLLQGGLMFASQHGGCPVPHPCPSPGVAQGTHVQGTALWGHPVPLPLPSITEAVGCGGKVCKSLGGYRQPSSEPWVRAPWTGSPTNPLPLHAQAVAVAPKKPPGRLLDPRHPRHCSSRGCPGWQDAGGPVWRLGGLSPRGSRYREQHRVPGSSGSGCPWLPRCRNVPEVCTFLLFIAMTVP